MKKGFIIIIIAEDTIGLLVRVAGIFSRRRILIGSLDVAPNEEAGICRFTITVTETEEVVRKLAQQLEKQIDIIKTTYCAEEAIVCREQVLYSAKSCFANQVLETGVRYRGTYDGNAVFEMTGTASSIDKLTVILRPYLTAMVKGGRASVTTDTILSDTVKKSEERVREFQRVANVIV